MSRRCVAWLVLIAGVGVAVALLPSAPGDEPVGIQQTAAEPAQAAPAMSARIDELLERDWKELGIEPAPPASDAEFIRRVTLDLTGTLPRVAEVREFLADDSPAKREALIDRLLASPRHPAHLANLWVRVLLPDSDDNEVSGADAAAFRRWLRERFASNLRYDNLAADLVMAQSTATDPGPALFYTSVQLKPEELAANTARVFLGVQVHCAQCHDHPHDHWKQTDFWGFAAFFAQVRQQAGRRQFGSMIMDTDVGDVKLPDTETVVLPKFLGGPEVAAPNGTRRAQLAIWLASRDNPFFAKAAVNRVWAMLFGHGMVEPIDNLGGRNAPKHPQLLDELAEHFIATDFNLRELLRTLVRTRAYQLSSQSVDQQDDVRTQAFARMTIKQLSAEQVFDCLNAASRLRAAEASSPAPALNLPDGGDPMREEFLSKFKTPAATNDYQGGIPQALTLMNGRIIAQATDPQQQGVLAAMEAPFFSDEERVDVLFLATLSRLPDDDERQPFVQHLSAAADRRGALGDVLWALLNSGEFILNH
ncbi:MAG: DUF1549 domain-containing protein [Planctomycetia bacterium]|nr:DUF1549 domain-containing protein [Planctomycetia bacterium]